MSIWTIHVLLSKELMSVKLSALPPPPFCLFSLTHTHMQAHKHTHPDTPTMEKWQPWKLFFKTGVPLLLDHRYLGTFEKD
jgi:hypothetical protein